MRPSFPFGGDFPYTDTHELNLDWIIKTIAELEERVAKLEAEQPPKQ